MDRKPLEELALAEGYPAADIDATRKKLAGVIEIALPALALRSSSALSQGKEEEELWTKGKSWRY